eukprot:m.153701 g.153701  ORF g.153701 m.153701 type:complete len:1019 (+) comp16240_c11_seq1:115-3171(+)
MLLSAGRPLMRSAGRLHISCLSPFSPPLLSSQSAGRISGRTLITGRALHPSPLPAPSLASPSASPSTCGNAVARGGQRRLTLFSRAAQASRRNARQFQRRSVSTGFIASLFVLSRRAVLYPAIVVGTIGAAAGELKKRLEFELPPGVNEISEGVGNVFDVLKAEFAHVRAKMTPELANENGTIKRRSKSSPPNDDGAAVAATATDGSDDQSGKQPQDDKAELIQQLEQLLQETQEANDKLKEEIKRLKEEHETELALLNQQLADVQEKLTHASDEAQRELQAERARLTKVIDRLKAENEELHRLQILRSQKLSASREKRAIDLFSEILDLRSQVDSEFDARERLPRVVVVGDQSAGKTSVLEVLVRARIFPRGAGEMMTRAPIQVTMSEGAHHTAKIREEDTVYNLRSERDLKNLRDRIEELMLASLDPDNVVSHKTLAIELEGPGLQPMVLVDLPGVIQHHTKGMPTTTKQNILQMCKKHITNPNAIILCIQDASRDAESSSVADLVRAADPEGDRTVFVLTKVDLAEKLSISKDKLQATLRGERFNMHARAYFAVVTGTANANDSIDVIRRNERQYFNSSPFFKGSQFEAEKMGTDNLSRLVSDIFWERVRETVAQEGMSIARALKRKETEWKNNYPNQARLSRDDLYNMGRHEILQNITAFNDTMTPAQWEMVLTEQIWNRISNYVLDEIYINSADSANPADFKTRVDNLLDAWVNSELPRLSVSAARDTLMQEFMNVLTIQDPDEVFTALKEEVKRVCSKEFQWNPGSISKIRSVQELMLRDDVVKARSDWDKAVRFMKATLEKEHQRTLQQLEEQKGPSTFWQWASWTRLKPEQRTHKAIIAELSTYFAQPGAAKGAVPTEEVRALQHSLKRKYGVDVSDDQIMETYHLLYKQHFLDQALKSAAYCQSKFGYREDACTPCNDLHCADVLLFWRLHNMLRATVNMLRLEAMDYKTEIQEAIRRVLNEIDENSEKKQNLIGGKRVKLAEEIEVLRLLQTKLDDFTRQMKKEGKLR